MIRLTCRCVHVSVFAAMLALALGGSGAFTADVRATPEGGYHPPGPGSADSIPLCPVTLPNGSVPPPGGTWYDGNGTPLAEQPHQDVYGNGQEWTRLPLDGVLMLSNWGDHRPDAPLETKLWWWTAPGIGGPTGFEGRRLDAPAPPLRAEIDPTYTGTFSPVGLIFPTEGCWEVTGHAKGASLTFVVLVLNIPAQPVPGTPPPMP